MRCSRCEKDKPAEAFPRHHQMSHGRHPRCRECHRILYRERAGFARRVCYLEKTCGTCGEMRPLANFPKRSDAFDGHENRCYRCRYAARCKSSREIEA